MEGTREAKILDEARAWLAEDPDAATRAELRALLEAGDLAAIRERFAERLEFGTAGIRGILGAGPGRMNRALVRRVTAGLGRTLLDDVERAAERGVAIAYDGRRLSAELAADAAAVLAGLGLRVHRIGGPVPTPLLAFGVLELDAAAGVMVTASHNPPEYNGYKVYWSNGAQIVPPIDARISEAIGRIGRLEQVAWLDEAEARTRGLLLDAPADLEARYLRALDAQALQPPHEDPASAPTVVYTPLHGVGRSLAVQALQRRGVGRVLVVAEQAEPDGAFPTVRFPNPEEPGAMDLAIALAGREDADLVLANDPDADRLAVVVREAVGRYRQLSGDELGALLGHHILETRRRSGTLPAGGFVVTTVVSSGLLGRMAEAYGVRCERTLTGFKWICNRAIELERQGGTFLFGYEEALGYCVGPAVRDKDGIGAAALLAEAACVAAREGLNLLQRLDEIHRRHGVVLTRQVSLHLPGTEGKARIERTISGLRSAPPATLAGHDVRQLGDLLDGQVRDLHSGAVRATGLPPSDVLVLELDGGSRVTVRPSGTEPKLKVYLEVREPVAAAARALQTARARAAASLDELEAAVRALL